VDEWREAGTRKATVTDVAILSDGSSIVAGCTDTSLDGPGVSLRKSTFVISRSSRGSASWDRELTYPGSGSCDVSLAELDAGVAVLHWAPSDSLLYGVDDNAFDITMLDTKGSTVWTVNRPRLRHQVASTGLVALSSRTLVYGLRVEPPARGTETNGYFGLRPDGTVAGEFGLPAPLNVNAMTSIGDNLLLSICAPTNGECRPEVKSVTPQFYPSRTER
jgi:hypothetical protein